MIFVDTSVFMYAVGRPHPLRKPARDFFHERKSIGPARTERLLDSLRIFAAAAAAFGGLKRAQDWLGTALPALGGDRPIDLCDTFEGRRLVREIIRKIEYGEFP